MLQREMLAIGKQSLRKMPPLEGAEAFLAAAHASSFRAAAASLALSPSAFSRRIQQLEAFVGTQLFVRANSSARLTPAGLAYLAAVEPAIEAVRSATSLLRQAQGERRIRLITSHSLATEWLVPRLPHLLAEHGIEVDLAISRDAQMLRSGEAELGVWGTMDAEPDIHSERLAPLEAVPVTARRLADGREPPASIDALGGYRLLSDRVSKGLWRRWLEQAGYGGVVPQFVDHFETNQLASEAAASGLGVALGLPLVAERYLDSNRLIACAPLRLPTGAAYCVHSTGERPAKGSTADVVTGWLREEALASLRKYERWWANARARLTMRVSAAV